MPQRSSRAAWALAGLAALSLWPYWGHLGRWPMTMDAVVWIRDGLPGAPRLLDWAFRTRQFGVGWRPLTALSYTLGTLLGGTTMHAQRVIDLLAHLLCVALVYAVARELDPRRPRWPAALAAGFFALHPAVDAVVPYLARRSYSLATACLLAALVVAMRALRAREISALALRGALAGVLLLAGFMFHEIAVVGALLVPLLGLAAAREGGWGPRRVALASLGPALFLAAGWIARARVVRGVGGYESDAGGALGSAVHVVAEFLRALLALEPAGSTAAAPAAAPVAAAAVVVPCYLWAAFAPARRGRWRPLALLAWFAGYGGLFALLGVWFPRQGYVAVAPLALLFAEVAAETAGRPGGAGRALAFAPQAALAALVLWHSPALRGPDPVRSRAWEQRDALLDAARRGLAEVVEPATVRLVLPYERPDAALEARRPKYKQRRDPLPREARQPERWMERLAAGRDVRFEELAFFESGVVTEAWPSLESASGRPEVRFPDGLAYFAGGERRGAGDARVLRADEPPLPSGRAAYLFLAAPGGGSLVRLDAREGPGAAGPGGPGRER